MSKAVSVDFEKITPKIAAEWLERNITTNRHYRASRAAVYAADMRAGRWQVNDTAISFDREGRLVNGQHRLEAVVQSGVSIRSVVLRGLPPESLLVLDNGLRRTTTDNLRAAGKEFPYYAPGTIRRLWLGVRHHSVAFSDQEVGDFMLRHEKAVLYVHALLPAGRFCTAAVRAVALRAVILSKPAGRLEKFAAVLKSGFMDRGDEAAVLLRNKIVEESPDQHGSAVRRAVYAYSEAALAAFLASERLAKLMPAAAELFPLDPADESPRERRVRDDGARRSRSA